MKKKDLKSGMLVKTRNGHLYIVLLNTGMEISGTSDKDVLLGINSEGNISEYGWMSLSGYNDNLENEDADWSIVEVFSTKYADDIGRPECYKSIWKRQNNV